MYSLTVNTSRGSYDVTIGHQILEAELTHESAVVADPVIAPRLQNWPHAVFIAANESEKTLSGVERLLIQLHASGLTRESRLVAVGGGVIQDLVTLGASIYMRGVDWTYFPTTMMAMLDSCIGGKSSINVASVKNLVGNIYPPSRVVVDVATAETLPVEARVAGYAEAVKICFAGGAANFDKFMDLVIPADRYGAASDAVEASNLTHHVLSVKKWFVEIDEFDKRERLLLNFGHTFGHALESALNFEVPHGVAIAIGMNAAIMFSPYQSQRTLVLQQYIASLTEQLPISFRPKLENPDWEQFSLALASDKKGSSAHLRFILEGPRDSLEIVEMNRNTAVFERAQEVAASALDQFVTRCGVSE